MSAKRVKTSAEERIFMFSSESVNEGHPDKVADQVSDAVLDACLTADPYSKVNIHLPVSRCPLVRASTHRRVARRAISSCPCGQAFPHPWQYYPGRLPSIEAAS